MRYDPVKDALGRLFGLHPALQRVFFRLLDVFFLRAWHVHRALRNLFAQLPEDRALQILDAGTGFGQYAYHIARTYPHARVLAIDIKADYLERMRRFLDRSAVGRRIETAVDDLTRLRAEGPFDLILAVDVLEHIEDDRAVLAHFERVLRPSGFVLINTPSDQGGSDVHGQHQERFIEEHVREGYSLHELESKLRDAGLKPVQSRYTYGRYGSLAWRLLIKHPIRMLGRSRASIVFLFFYYLPAFPIGMLLHALDVRRINETGTGLLVIAEKPYE
jgi:SAM-dependent methyltransferase